LTKEGWEEAKQDKLLSDLAGDYKNTDIPLPDMVMLDYSVKLTRTPGDMTAEDVLKLRTVGFDDRAIHDICACTSYFAFVNRIADGLGVQLESRFL
jgi:uncharacterized peroxidase-related enzyme